MVCWVIVSNNSVLAEHLSLFASKSKDAELGQMILIICCPYVDHKDFAWYAGKSSLHLRGCKEEGKIWDSNGNLQKWVC